jgi:hypothetical protein
VRELQVLEVEGVEEGFIKGFMVKPLEFWVD